MGQTVHVGCSLCLLRFTDSLSKTTLDTSRCAALYEKTLDRCLWTHCPSQEGANCYKSHRLLYLRYVGL